MYELIRVTKQTSYIECPSKMGLFVQEGEALLIDTGNGKDSAKRALRHITDRGWTLKTILNTHCHADHIGGNAYLMAQTGAAAYSMGAGVHFARNPALGVGFLYGGNPPKPLLNRQMLAEPSDVREVSPECLPKNIELFPLPGHCPNMFGVTTPDGVCFLSDCVSSAQVLEKYHITLIYDVAAHLNTLALLEKRVAALFVPAHAPATEDIRPLARLNIQKTEEIAAQVRGLIKGGRTAEGVLHALFQEYAIAPNITQHTLLKTTVLSYLTYLMDNGWAEMGFEGEQAIFRAV